MLLAPTLAGGTRDTSWATLPSFRTNGAVIVIARTRRDAFVRFDVLHNSFYFVPHARCYVAHHAGRGSFITTGMRWGRSVYPQRMDLHVMPYSYLRSDGRTGELEDAVLYGLSTYISTYNAERPGSESLYINGTPYIYASYFFGEGIGARGRNITHIGGGESAAASDNGVPWGWIYRVMIINRELTEYEVAYINRYVRSTLGDG